MPVIKTKKAIDAMQSGQVLEVISTDPGTKSDISALLDRLGHELLQIKEEGGIAEFYIEKNNLTFIEGNPALLIFFVKRSFHLKNLHLFRVDKHL